MTDSSALNTGPGQAESTAGERMLKIECAIGGAYEMPDGRKFWIDGPVAREMARRVLGALYGDQA